MESLKQSVVEPPIVAAQNPLALSLNENPFSPLPAVRAAIVEAVGTVNRYPEFLPERLRSVIAGHLGVNPEQIIVGAGATGVIMQTLQALTSPGDRIMMAWPTFDGYPIFARMARLKPVMVPLDAEGRHDLDTMADAASDARVVVLCRPHNPSGALEPIAEVYAFLGRIPRDALVLLDEAYIEFVARHLRIDAPSLVEQFPNVVVVRTFSKAYGLAGMRAGYCFCSTDMARTLWRMQLPFGTTVASLAAVTASYRAESQLRQRVRLITAERKYLRMRLMSMGVYSTDSHANFVYLPPTGRPWAEAFDDAGLQVRVYSDGGVRITVGNRASTNAVLEAIAGSTRAVAQ